MTPVVHPVLLCGGSGSRLWPLSRKSFPKQFSPLTGELSLFQASARRLSGPGLAPPTVVTNAEFRFIVVEQLAKVEISPARILIEPEAKNTAAAICSAAIALEQADPGAMMLVAPSDHEIPDTSSFLEAVGVASGPASEGHLVTLGICPDRPETAFGWIELDAPFDKTAPPKVARIRSFTEKPDLATAERLFKGRKHLWNAGVFLFTTTAILEAFAQFEPALLAACQAALNTARTDLGFTRLSAEPWADCPNVSIDYAIMERAENLQTVPLVGSWSDLGNWDAVWRENPRDDRGVVTTGAATAIDCADTLLQSTSDSQRLVGVGLSNIIAVAMPDAVLVADKSSVQKVGYAVEKLKSLAIPQAENFPRAFRPWGWSESLVQGPRFHVRQIVVHPGAGLSLQSHIHRAEHWVIVEGTARITLDDAVSILTENQSAFIPVGAIHRLENPGKVQLVLIEVQTGGYLGEDDVVRLEDGYPPNSRASFSDPSL